MQVILNKNEYINSLIGQQSISNDEFRFLKFSLILDVKTSKLIYNLLTKELLMLEDYEFNSIGKNNHLTNYLIQNWFLVSKDFNDFNFYTQVFQVFKNLENEEIRNYTVVTTTECNARCYYCYQYGTPKMSMNTSLAYDISKFFLNNYIGKRIHISWFGGEPLYNINPINIIADELNNKNVEFDSSIITNGYLFDEKLIKSAVDTWHLKKAQITLDGTADKYRIIKNYINNDNNPFNTVVDNIYRLTENEVKVVIRINLGVHNIDDVYELTYYLIEKFANNKFISVYPRLLFENVGLIPKINTENENNILYTVLDDIENILIQNKLFSLKPLTNGFKSHACMTDSRDSLVIAPNGNLAKCENLIEKNICGNIYEGITDITEIEHLSQRIFFDKCYDCPILPNCIILSKCPTQTIECHNYEQEFKIRKIKQRMKLTCDIFNSRKT